MKKKRRVTMKKERRTSRWIFMRKMTIEILIYGFDDGIKFEIIFLVVGLIVNFYISLVFYLGT